MISALHDDEHIVLDAVHQAVFLADAPRPMAPQIAFQRLGFADTAERRALALFYQGVDFEHGFHVQGQPLHVVFPGSFVPRYPHWLWLNEVVFYHLAVPGALDSGQ